jgi:DHA1 family bicyclomycin/chloramphenicol resistance-like MFS transporter
MVRDEARPAATLRLVVVLGCVGAFAPLAVDMYLPGWPEIQDTLGASASAVQLTLTSFLLGLAAGQLMAGPLSDRFGRRVPLLAGLVAFVGASVLCAASPSIALLVLARFAQGCAGGAGIAVARAVVRDLGSREEVARNFSLLILINNIGPIVAPVAGGQLLHVTDWRGVFVALGLLALVLAAVAWRVVPESLAHGARATGGLAEMGATLREVGTDRAFLGYALSSGLTFGSLTAYLAASSFVLQDMYGFSPQAYGAFFAINGVGIVVVTYLNGRLLGRFTSHTLLLAGMVMSAAGAATLGIAVGTGDPPLAALLPAFFLIVASLGLVQPNGTTLAMEPHPRVAGSASALLGLVQSVGGAAVAPLVGVAGTQSAVPLAVIVGALTLAAWLALLLTRGPRAVEAPSVV